MNYFINKLARYKDFINIMTVLLLLVLPITSGKFVLFLFMLILLTLYEFMLYLFNLDFAAMWTELPMTLIAVAYIVMSITIVAQSLYLIKRRMAPKWELACTILMTIAGIYSLYSNIQKPNVSTLGLLVLFFIFLSFRWGLASTYSRMKE